MGDRKHHPEWRNELLGIAAYQQSNKISPFSAAVCVPLALVMITLVVAKLDRLTRPLAGLRILDELTSGHSATCAAVAELLTQHSAEMLSNRVTRQ